MSEFDLRAPTLGGLLLCVKPAQAGESACPTKKMHRYFAGWKVTVLCTSGLRKGIGKLVPL